MSNNRCVLCSSTENYHLHSVLPANDNLCQEQVMLCQICSDDIDSINPASPEHWRCLNDSMWSPNIAIQVLAWRQLNKLKELPWAASLFDMIYLEEDVLAWAQAGLMTDTNHGIIHKDSNGVILSANDSVTIVKDLPVKGSSMVAKRGTVVKKISLVLDNAEHIEGRVDGQKIVILTKFVKKS